MLGIEIKQRLRSKIEQNLKFKNQNGIEIRYFFWSFYFLFFKVICETVVVGEGSITVIIKPSC